MIVTTTVMAVMDVAAVTTAVTAIATATTAITTAGRCDSHQ